jgi:hypothetical protein
MNAQTNNDHTCAATKLADEICAYIFHIEDKTRATLADISKDTPAQERLLEATMTLLDTMKDSKGTIQEWRTQALKNPSAGRQIAPVYMAAITRMLDALDVKNLTNKSLLTQPYLQLLEHAMRGLISPSPAFLYAGGFVYWINIWLKDESADECYTLSVIDAHLQRFC